MNTTPATLLWDEISTISGEGLLDTIHLVVVRPNVKIEDAVFVSSICSKSIVDYKRALDEFLIVDKCGRATRSLLYDEFDGGVYWYTMWDGEVRTRRENSQLKPMHESVEYEWLPPEDTGSSASNTQKLTTWKHHLQASFPKGGSTLWLPVSYTAIVAGKKQKFISSAFCVFSEALKREVIDRIAKKLIEYLIGRMIEFQELYVHARFAGEFTRYVGEQDAKLCTPDNVKNQIESLKLVLRSKLPILVEGEPGTGKITVARNVLHGAFSGYHARPDSGSTIKLLVLNCGELSSSEFKAELKRLTKKLIKAKNNKRIIFSIIFDDIHLMDNGGQIALTKFLKKFSYQEDIEKISNRPLVAVTISPGADDCLHNGSLIYDLYVKLSPFAVSLPTLQQRLIEAEHGNDSDRLSLIRELVTIFTLKLMNYIPVGEALVKDIITNISETLVKEKKWDGNYTELRQRVLQLYLVELQSLTKEGVSHE